MHVRMCTRWLCRLEDLEALADKVRCECGRLEPEARALGEKVGEFERGSESGGQSMSPEEARKRFDELKDQLNVSPSNPHAD